MKALTMKKSLKFAIDKKSLKQFLLKKHSNMPVK